MKYSKPMTPVFYAFILGLAILSSACQSKSKEPIGGPFVPPPPSQPPMTETPIPPSGSQPAIPGMPTPPKPNQYHCTARVTDYKTSKKYVSEKEVVLDPEKTSKKALNLLSAGSFKVNLSIIRNDDILISFYKNRELVHQGSGSVRSQYISAEYSPAGDFRVSTSCSIEKLRTAEDSSSYPHVDTLETPLSCSVKITPERGSSDDEGLRFNRNTNEASQIELPLSRENLKVTVGKTKTHYFIETESTNRRSRDNNISSVRASHNSNSLSALLVNPRTGATVKIGCAKQD